MPGAIRLQAGNCLLFHQYAATRNADSNIRPTSIDARKSVLTQPIVAKRPGMIANSALFHDRGSSS